MSGQGSATIIDGAPTARLQWRPPGGAITTAGGVDPMSLRPLVAIATISLLLSALATVTVTTPASAECSAFEPMPPARMSDFDGYAFTATVTERSEEHTSELQSHVNLVCRLLLEKKKQQNTQENAVL